MDSLLSAHVRDINSAAPDPTSESYFLLNIPTALRLPPELFHKILGNLDFKEEEHQPLPLCITVSQVCHQWRDQARTYPDLWTQIPVGRVAWTQQALKYAVSSWSRHLLLTVHATWGEDQSLWPSYGSMQLVANERHRIGELNIQNENTSAVSAVQSVLRLFDGLSAPSLTRLDFGHRMCELQLDDAFLSGGTPTLATIIGFNFRASSQLPILFSPNLTCLTLDIGKIWSRLDVLLDGLMRVSRSLELLSLSAHDVDWDSLPAAFEPQMFDLDIPTIVFPHVKDCCITDQIERLSLLMGFLNFPACSNMLSLTMLVRGGWLRSRPLLEVFENETENIADMFRIIFDPPSLDNESAYELRDVGIQSYVNEFAFNLHTLRHAHSVSGAVMTQSFPIVLSFEWSNEHPLPLTERGSAMAAVLRRIPGIERTTILQYEIRANLDEDGCAPFNVAAHGWLELSSALPNVNHVFADDEGAVALIAQLAAAPAICFPKLERLVFEGLDFRNEYMNRRIDELVYVLGYRHRSLGAHPRLEVCFDHCDLTNGQKQRLLSHFGHRYLDFVLYNNVYEGGYGQSGMEIDDLN